VQGWSQGKWVNWLRSAVRGTVLFLTKHAKERLIWSAYFGDRSLLRYWPPFSLLDIGSQLQRFCDRIATHAGSIATHVVPANPHSSTGTKSDQAGVTSNLRIASNRKEVAGDEIATVDRIGFPALEARIPFCDVGHAVPWSPAKYVRYWVFLKEALDKITCHERVKQGRDAKAGTPRRLTFSE
jgi:hypothetical protein